MALPKWIPNRFPIRLKFLVMLLLVTTAVLGVITFTMGRLFRSDKEAYIRDLASATAQSTAEEARSLLSGYRERLQVYTRLLAAGGLTAERKSAILQDLFEDFREFVAVTVYVDGKEVTTLADAKALSSAGLTAGDLARQRAEQRLQPGRMEPGTMHVENSTLSAKMPAMTMMVAQDSGPGERRVVVEAVLRLDGLMRIARRSGVFERFLVDDQGVLLAHPDAERVSRRAMASWIPDLSGLLSVRSVGAAVEYSRDGVETIGGFAPVERAGVLAGAQVPRSAAYLASRTLLRNLALVALGLMLSSALLGVALSRRVTRNLERLSETTREIGQGRFDVKVDVASRDEIGTLAASFNDMAAELSAREKALLESQAQLVQSEKLAAFGQLGAGIAHEVKNPLAGILGYVQLSLRKLEPESALHNNLKIVEKETKRCRTIIDNLLKFTRQEKVAQEPTDVNQVAEDTAMLVDHQLGMHRIRLEKALAEGLPRIVGNANQLQQVLLNIILNAEQAMEGNPGTVRIETEGKDGMVEIRVRDTGPGIPKEIQAKLFDPFFTTKPAGKGTGLGLSVSYGIVKDHRGDILVRSEPGQGACFILRIPAMPDAGGAGRDSGPTAG
jgi:signal transduction histidine kinase